MQLEPNRNAVLVPIRKKVNNLVSLKVADDGAVPRSVSPRPVINTDDPWRNRRLEPRRPHQTQYCVSADWHRQFLGESRTRLTTNRQANGELTFRQAHGTSSMRPHDIRNAL